MVNQKPPGQGEAKDTSAAEHEARRVAAHVRSMLAKLKAHVAAAKAADRRER